MDGEPPEPCVDQPPRDGDAAPFKGTAPPRDLIVDAPSHAHPRRCEVGHDLHRALVAYVVGDQWLNHVA